MAKLVKISDISRFGNHLARAVRRNLAWSKQLGNPKSVVLTKAKEEGSIVSITVAVGEKTKDKSGNPLSGMARAYEYGSGLQATRSMRKKYLIVPRKKPFLVFSSTQGGKGLAGARIRVSKVMHPGVDPRPFMTPARQEVRGKATEELAIAIKKNLIEAMNVEIRKIKQK